MYYFFSIAFALCTITIGSILHRYAEKSTPWHVRIVVFYAWLCAVIIICLVPLDMWAVSPPVQGWFREERREGVRDLALSHRPVDEVSPPSFPLFPPLRPTSSDAGQAVQPYDPSPVEGAVLVHAGPHLVRGEGKGRKERGGPKLEY